MNQSILFFLILSLIGCGGREYRAPQSLSVGSVVTSSAPMTGADVTLATNICEAFRFKKSHILLNNKIGTQYSHRLTKEQCSGAPQSEVVTSSLEQIEVIGGYLFRPATTPANKFFTEMQTNTHGYLSDLCEKILGGSKVDSRNIISTSSEIVQLEFSLSGFEVVRSKKNESGDFVAYEVEAYEIDIDTTDTTENSTHGMVVEATLTSKCDNDSVIKLSQELL